MAALQFSKERDTYKKLVRNKLDEVLKTDRSQTIITKFQLKSYQFMIAQEKHYAAVMDFMAKDFTKNAPLFIVFELNQETSRQLLIPSIKAKLEAGRVIIIIDQG